MRDRRRESSFSRTSSNHVARFIEAHLFRLYSYCEDASKSRSARRMDLPRYAMRRPGASGTVAHASPTISVMQETAACAPGQAGN
jgi:hypothetical protein